MVERTATEPVQGQLKAKERYLCHKLWKRSAPKTTSKKKKKKKTIKNQIKYSKIRQIFKIWLINLKSISLNSYQPNSNLTYCDKWW